MKTRKNKNSKNSKHVKHYHAPDNFSKAMLKFIDEASEILKDGIVAGARESAKGRNAIKQKALSVVDIASKRLNAALDEGSDLLRKSLRKI